jgi:hypothetical protein
MTDVDASATAAAPDTPRGHPLRRNILLGVGIIVGAVVLSYAFPLLFLMGLQMAYVMVGGGAIYGVVGMAAIAYRWVTVPRRPATEVQPEDLAAVTAFRTRAQWLTLSFNLVLLLNLAVLPLTTQGEGLFNLIVHGLVAELFGIALILVNVKWAYRRRYILGETRAIAGRSGAWKLILTNRVLSYAVWALYTVAAWLLAFGVPFSWSSPL